MFEALKRWSHRIVSGVVRMVRSRRFLIVSSCLVVGTVGVQLLLPYDRAFLFSTVDGQSISLKTKDDIVSLLDQRYANARVVTKNPDTDVSFREAGIKVDTSTSAQQAVSYPLWQRIIPFSSIYMFFSHQKRSSVDYQELPLSQWAKTVSAACYAPAKDASIAATSDGSLAVVPSAAGALCETDDLVASLRSTTLAPVMQVDTRRTILQPKRTDGQVSSQLDSIQRVIDQGVRVTVLGSETVAEPAEIVSWLTFADGENGRITLDVDEAKLDGFIQRVQAPVYVQPGVTTIALLDGRETSRMNGSAGRGIDRAKLVGAIRTQLQSLSNETITAQVTSLPPREDIQRNYTNSTLGLQTLLTDLAAENGDMAIAIQELGGQARGLSANGTKQYHPASTYKLFIAYSIIKRIEANQLKWDDQINGKTVEACLGTMIIDSDNACAEAFAEQFSWRTIQAELRALGMASTDLNRAEPVSTVTDQVLFLRKLHDNQLMKPEHKDRLLALMKQQRFRAGVPAGVPYEVADKVGFLSGLLHDSAIVYGPNGGYIISVYSNGGAWGDIADATRRINNLINS